MVQRVIYNRDYALLINPGLFLDSFETFHFIRVYCLNGLLGVLIGFVPSVLTTYKFKSIS